MSKTYRPQKGIDYIFYFFFLCFLGLLSYWLYTIFSRETFNINFLLILNTICLLYIFFNYLLRIEKIEFYKDDLIVKTKLREYCDKKTNFHIKEVDKLTSTLTKYSIIILENKKLKKIFKINSLDWQDYTNLKIDLMKGKINE